MRVATHQEEKRVSEAMRIISLAMPSLLVTTLLVGCVLSPEEETIGEDSEDQLLPSEEAALTANALDGRAAAAAEAKTLGILPSSTLSLTSSWYSGSIDPGATKHWYWNNSSLTAAFHVGLSPIGASTASACQLEVTRQWDVQKYGGEREFHFYIKNTGAIACGANILLGSKQSFNTVATGGIAAGASKSWTWNNANPLTASHLIGVSPSGATSTDSCQLEVTRLWYVRQPGERELKFTVKNVGAIACQGDVQLALTTDAASSWSTSNLSPGGAQSWVWNNANPLDRVYVPGLSPGSSVTPCQLEVTQSYYRQVINSGGSTEREFRFTVKNAGTSTCLGTVLLNYLD